MKTEIEIIGEALFGKSWMSQVAENLKDQNGESIARQSVQNWHRRDNLPVWAKDELKKLAVERFRQIENLTIAMGENYHFVDKRINEFLMSDAFKTLKVGDIIFCRGLIFVDKYKNEVYDAEITLEEQQYNVGGWKKIELEDIDIKRGAESLRKQLVQKIVHVADYYHDESKDEPDLHFCESFKLTSIFR